jgi:hypothetical protein
MHSRPHRPGIDALKVSRGSARVDVNFVDEFLAPSSDVIAKAD